MTGISPVGNTIQDKSVHYVIKMCQVTKSSHLIGWRSHDLCLTEVCVEERPRNTGSITFLLSSKEVTGSQLQSEL